VISIHFRAFHCIGSDQLSHVSLALIERGEGGSPQRLIVQAKLEQFQRGLAVRDVRLAEVEPSQENHIEDRLDELGHLGLGHVVAVVFLHDPIVLDMPPQVVIYLRSEGINFRA